MSDMKLSWNNHEIGSIIDAKVDNFFVYGEWRRHCSEDTWTKLLECLNHDGEVIVDANGEGKPLRGLLLVEPDDDEIEIRLDPNLN